MAAGGVDVLVLVLNDVSCDGRVRAEAAALAEDGRRVLIVGTQRAGGTFPDRETSGGVEVRRVRYAHWGAGLWRPWRWLRHGLQGIQIWRALDRIPARAYHAHDLPALVLLSALRVLRHREARLVYDAHELYLFRRPFAGGQPPRGPIHALGMALEGALARRADAVIALCDARARLLARWYRIPRPVLIRNAVNPPAADARPPVDLRALAGADCRLIVHTGHLANERRALDELLRAVALLPLEVGLVLLGQGEGEAALRQQAAALGIAQRVWFVPPVPPEHVAATIRCADAAAILMRGESWNTRAGLPNKFYEALAAGLPLVASDLPLLRRRVARDGLGLLCDASDPASIAGALREVLYTDTGRRCREQARALREGVCWDAEADRLRALYRALLP